MARDIGAMVDQARARLARLASTALTDKVTFTKPGTATEDAFHETTTTDAPAISNLPCSYEALSAYEREKGGEVTSGATHKLQIPANSDTLQITGSYKGVIAARGLSPALNIEVTGRLDSSINGWLFLAIILKG